MMEIYELLCEYKKVNKSCFYFFFDKSPRKFLQASTKREFFFVLESFKNLWIEF